VAQVALSEVIVGTALIVITRVAVAVLQVPAPLLAVMVTLGVPSLLVFPNHPVLVLTLRPASGLAVARRVLVAVIV